MTKENKARKVVEAYNDKQYNEAKQRGDVIIDRRGMTRYERSGESEPVDVFGVGSDEE